jgi:hypothetical protein
MLFPLQSPSVNQVSDLSMRFFRVREKIRIQILSSWEKFLIAIQIIKQENPHALNPISLGDHWYHAVWNSLVSEIDDAGKLKNNKVRFVSFNYDRSLEGFLQEATENTFGIPGAEALAAWSEIPILHVYGLVGKFLSEPGLDGRPYVQNCGHEEVRLASEGIKIIPEFRNGDPEFRVVREWFEWSERICFLGFGFDELNIQRLAVSTFLNDMKLQGRPHYDLQASCFGLTNAERQHFGALLTQGSGNINFGNPGWKCLQDLRETGLLLQ